MLCAMFGPRVLRELHGVFAVYKPAGVTWRQVRSTMENRLLQELNALKQPGPRQLVKVETLTTATERGEERSLAVSLVPSLADHPLVRGPRYHSLGLAVGHGLDASASGVLVFAVGSGRRLLDELRKSPVTQAYTLHGRLGIATEDFSTQGRVIETVTYEHVTRDLMERAVAMMHGAAQKALLLHSDVDVGSHEGYLRAVSGCLLPSRHKMPALITAVRLADFNPPAFTLGAVHAPGLPAGAAPLRPRRGPGAALRRRHPPGAPRARRPPGAGPRAGARPLAPAARAGGRASRRPGGARGPGHSGEAGGGGGGGGGGGLPERVMPI
uniref:Mitochondrial mRNA pseudouridine synthase Trub2-like isoform X2 n=1 Tax=Petromyzon marinus TaxID=7757 RepID=A0AAJ7XF05_PETMA|nr:mitochondrial mRNA pseudouridine synthase Trub2-like isoform X2 [Petromyzon marinus]XP_032832295.1 mitochondrial mRNA pseudouridine synthase Trub2-like isoform X2 [Petromyzon marinus]